MSEFTVKDDILAKAELLRKAFKYVVAKNEIALRVVNRVAEDASNELVFKNVAAFIQTVPAQWTVSCRPPYAHVTNML